MVVLSRYYLFVLFGVYNYWIVIYATTFLLAYLVNTLLSLSLLLILSIQMLST